MLQPRLHQRAPPHAATQARPPLHARRAPPAAAATSAPATALPSGHGAHAGPLAEERHAGEASTSSPACNHMREPVSHRSSRREIKHLQLDLPPATHSRVKKAVFVKSSPSVKDCPPDRYPEFALIGRSNVGKSSLINCLTEQAKLAKVSREPGMTKLINHYLINDSWYLVDLPGYGFAQTASKASRDGWLDFTKDFFISRDNLVHVLLLVDASVPPQRVDLDCARWLAECEVPFAIAFTKMDAERRSKGEGASCARNMRGFKEALAEDWEELPWCFETSSKNGAGRSELLGYLASLRQLHLTAGR